MLAEQEHYTCVQSPVEIQARTPKLNAIAPQFNPSVISHGGLFEYAANAPATLAERHPRLTVIAISAAVLITAVAIEIDYLAGSGYFWR